MVEIKEIKAYDVPGVYISGYQLKRMNLWNNFDDLALYKSLVRIPNESNLSLRSRLLKAKDYNSTKQGLVNWISDSLNIEKYTVKDKRIYVSTYIPLSFMAYNRLTNPEEVYYSPRIISNGVEIVFPIDKMDITGGIDIPGSYMYNTEKTVVYDGSASWTLWKNVDQTYMTLWETNTTPPLEIKLKYQYIIDDRMYIIEESPKTYTRDIDNNIILE